MQYVYAISDGYNIKIGVSKHPEKRIKQLNTGNAESLYLLGYFEGDRKLEKYIHDNFRKVRFNGEWMYPTEELLDYLNNKIDKKYIMITDGKVKSYLCLRK